MVAAGVESPRPPAAAATGGGPPDSSRLRRPIITTNSAIAIGIVNGHLNGREKGVDGDGQGCGHSLAECGQFIPGVPPTPLYS